MSDPVSILIDAEQLRQRVRNRATETLSSVFPLQLRTKQLHLEDVRVTPGDFGPEEERRALLTKGSLEDVVKGTLVLKDLEGKELDRVKNFTLTHLPYLTDRHTLIMDGTEYQVANQLRRKPGVYTTQADNNDLWSVFNLGRGKNFKIGFSPDKGTFHVNYGTTNIPLYPILRGLGMTHEDIQSHWGLGVADANRALHGKDPDKEVHKLYQQLEHPALLNTSLPTAGKVDVIKRKYEMTTLDPRVTEGTLGARYDKVTPQAMASAAARILSVHKGTGKTDDVDALTFKTFHSIDDFIAERLRLAHRAWALKAKFALSTKNSLSEALHRAPFSDSVRKFVTTSSLSSVPTGINPVELLDHAVKVTSLGEGGIGSDRAIPLDARMIHNTHAGTLDPIRTPESFHSGVDIRASIAAHRDNEGNLYTVARNVRTNKEEFLKAGELNRYVVAFPGQKLTGTVDAFVKGRVERVPASQVTHQIMHVSHLYSPATSLLPLIHTMQGNRAIMASKMVTQALPLVEREVPWVQSKSHLPGEVSFETVYGHMVVPSAPVSGKVHKIENGWIYIKPDAVVPRTKKAIYEEDLEKTAAAPSAVIITGNPRYIKNNPKAETFYRDIEDHLSALGYTVQRDPGEPYTSPVFADLWIGHSRGADRLRFAKPGTRTIAFGSSREGAINHPDDIVNVTPHTFTPPDAHYVLTNAMREALGRTKTAAKGDEDLVRVPFQTMFPFPSKTYLHHDLIVKPGDRVEAGQRLADSNYTRNGTLALGRNLRIAYVPYYGQNSNDGIVISEGCAKKLTSEHMYREVFPLTGLIELNKTKHQMYYGTKYTPSQYAGLDTHGVIRKGVTVHHGDLLVAGLTRTEIVGTDLLLGRISKALSRPYQEVVLTWTHETPGEIVEVVRTASQIAILVKTLEPMGIGDKLSARHGNKGVVSTIIPDHEMLQDESGKPLDILITSASVVSRINPSQILEASLGKVAEKTGKPIIYDNNEPRNAVQWTKDLLKKHGVKDKEVLFDPKNKRHIKGADDKGVFVGREFFVKAFKTTATNFAGHGVGPYDLNQAPLKTGGEDSAKGFGKMEIDALLAHNARNFLREASTVKGQKNDEYWKAIQLGLPPPEPKVPFVFNKFLGMLEGAGIKVDQRGSKFKLLPLTDKDVLARSQGAIKNKQTLIAKNLMPETGGLFDPILTGGREGTLYTHIDLPEPIPNPVFREPVRRILGLSEKDFEHRLAHEGGQWFQDRLKALDVSDEMKRLRAQIKTAKGSVLNDLVKRYKYLEALRKEGLRPHEAYITSKVAVIPPVFRPILPSPGNTSELMVGDANKLYGHLLDSTQVLTNTALAEDRPKHRQKVYNAVAALYGTEEVDNDKLKGQGTKGFLSNIAGIGTPKGGFFQRKVLRKNQDVSGRGTIVPDPTLGLDDVGLPEDMIWQMYDKFIVARLIRTGYPALDAKERVLKRDHIATQAMLAEIKERPVILNRAPTLHRWSMLAAYPKPVKGKTIRYSTFMEQGMGADYDGDAIQVHAPLSQDAIEDVKHMRLSEMLLSDQQRNKLLAFPQHEAIVGFTHASKLTAEGTPKHFESMEHATAAWRKGELKLTDPVTFGTEKRAELDITWPEVGDVLSSFYDDDP